MKQIGGPVVRYVIGGVLAMSGAASAGAAPLVGDFYVALNGGLVVLEDTSIHYVGDVFAPLRLGFDPGWVVSGAAGWRLFDLYRVELEGAFRDNAVSSVEPGYSPGGWVKATTAMVNGYFDFPNYEGVVPHVGVGLGRAQLVHEIQADSGTLSDSGGHAFAYQVIGGLEFPIVSRRLASTLEYRYLGTARTTFRDVNGFEYRSPYYSHAFVLGLRWAF